MFKHCHEGLPAKKIISSLYRGKSVPRKIYT